MIERLKAWYAPVAQLDRVTGYEPVGRGFESLPAYQKDPVAAAAGSFFLLPGASDIPAQGDSAFPSGKLLHIFGCFLAPNGRKIHNYRVQSFQETIFFGGEQ